jgi:hypothetical protein
VAVPANVPSKRVIESPLAAVQVLVWLFESVVAANVADTRVVLPVPGPAIAIPATASATTAAPPKNARRRGRRGRNELIESLLDRLKIKKRGVTGPRHPIVFDLFCICKNLGNQVFTTR